MSKSTETESETTETTEAESGALSRDEVKSLIGEVLDEKLEGISSQLSKLDILDSLSNDIDGLFEKHKTTPTDSKGLLNDIGRMIDSKMQGGSVSGNAGRNPGPLGRWLGGNRNGD